MIGCKCDSPLGEYEIHCSYKQMKKIMIMFEAENDKYRTDEDRKI